MELTKLRYWRVCSIGIPPLLGLGIALLVWKVDGRLLPTILSGLAIPIIWNLVIGGSWRNWKVN